MHRFFENIENKIGDIVTLSKENIKHFSVVRIEENEEFEIVISGIVYRCIAIEVSKSQITCKILGEVESNTESKLKIHLFQGLPKSDKLELIIQKCTELGISEITPFTSSRTIVKWDDKKESRRLERYFEIAQSASKQSKRTLVPKINRVSKFTDLKDLFEDSKIIVAYENRGTTLREVLTESNSNSFSIVIGPEGGFSELEIETLENLGAKIVHLGNRILRTETAAIALTTMIQYELGDVN